MLIYTATAQRRSDATLSRPNDRRSSICRRGHVGGARALDDQWLIAALVEKLFVISEDRRRKREAEGPYPKDWLLIPREDLYARVWSTPSRALAEEFGISDVYLGKLCQELQIPKPPRGYWRQIAAGQKPSRPRLRTLRGDQPSILVIPPRAKRPPKPPPDPTLPGRIAEARAPENRIVVADELHAPHPLIRQSRQILVRAKQNYDKLLIQPSDGSCLDITVSKGALPRALLLMDALLKALVAQGWGVRIAKESPAHTFVIIGDAAIRLRLAEKVEQQETERGKNAKPNEIRWRGEHWIPVPIGRLTLAIGDTYGAGARKWRDSDEERLEDQLNKVVVGLMRAAEANRVQEVQRAEEQRQREEAERRRREEEARRQEIERLKREEEARWHALEAQAERWTRSQALRAFLQACEARLHAERGELPADSAEAAWLRWAYGHAERLDPFAQGYLERAIAGLPVDSPAPAGDDSAA